ncbi:protein detoxification 46 [Quercus suber]|uniref:Protein detoxification 46 n=1 Tax=Quercus suber TaxID=58331 RepID=A0AAW0LG13_QUESU
MQFKTLTSHNTPLFQNPTFFSNKLPQPSPRFPISLFHSNLSLISTPKNSFRNRIVTASRISSNNKELIGNDDIGPEIDIVSVSGEEEEEKVSELGSENIWKQMKEIVMFTGPATGLWICGPLMSLIDTAVIGQGSSIELAALGIDKNEVQHHISILLFVGLTCGCLMLLFTKFFGSWVLTDSRLSMACTSCWMGCSECKVIAGFMMIEALNKKGYNAYSISVPSPDELLTVLGLAAPVFITMISKVAFYSLIIYFVTSMGTYTMAAHQVMIQAFVMCTVWSGPLSQTAQSFMPELIYGAKRSLEKARMLLKSLVIIGAVLGLLLGIVGTSVPWLFPKIFTHDQNVIQEMHKVLIPYFMALAVTPQTHSLEGALLAGRDLKFLSLSMSGCFAVGALLLLVQKYSLLFWCYNLCLLCTNKALLSSFSQLVTSRGYGLPGCWFASVGFQWVRFFLCLWRLLSPNGILYSEDLG